MAQCQFLKSASLLLHCTHIRPEHNDVFRSCLRFLEIAGRLFQAVVALFICPASTETNTNDSRPCPALEKNDGEDDAESETERGFDDEVREAAIPLKLKRKTNRLDKCSILLLECSGVIK